MLPFCGPKYQNCFVLSIMGGQYNTMGQLPPILHCSRLWTSKLCTCGPPEIEVSALEDSTYIKVTSYNKGCTIKDVVAIQL